VTHPVLTATAAVATALKSVADVNPTFMSTGDKATALRRLVAVESQLTELRLRILADAGDVAETTAAHDAGEWLSVATRGRFEEARADLALAQALDRRYALLAEALRAGDANLAQSRVIARALDALSDDVPADLVALAEATLVGHAAEFGPRQLARLGRRILDVVAPEIADAAEARRLAELESEARRRTRLTLRRCGDGTTRIGGLLPDAAATRLATYLEAFTNPRRTEPTEGGDPVVRLAYPRRLGEAFCQLLETVDPMRLPMHAGDATTVVVTLSLDALQAELATADLLTGGLVPGHDLTGDQITAAEARRLACGASIVPAVLGGASEVLDLGRARRLHSPAQRKALRLRDRNCRAEGCDLPGHWCEAHHWQPWSAGGSTDLDNSLLLCHHHHQRVHDRAFRSERLANGDVRFHRRR
jgi:Domain of unknown function (DUF222)/HNH endonuclease